MFRFIGILGSLVLGFSEVSFAAADFQPRELFRIPFGPQREALGAEVKDGNFAFPRDFTMDEAGRFYIYDSNKHRIARFSAEGTFQMGFRYPETAQQIFAHADGQKNLWLLFSDSIRGIYYGVYDASGKRLREAIFSQFNQFRLHLDDDYLLRVILSSSKNPGRTQTFLLHEESLLLKKENIARPPEDHHRVQKNDRRYFIDVLPGAASDPASPIQRITDESRRTVGTIQGRVLYVTSDGDIYTRVGDRQIYIYDIDGKRKGHLTLTGLPSSWNALRFDATGNIYQLDGIPNDSDQYTPEMSGLRLIQWQRR